MAAFLCSARAGAADRMIHGECVMDSSLFAGIRVNGLLCSAQAADGIITEKLFALDSSSPKV